ncbi:alpha/beta fold hydrolase [Roseateles sp. UC29_93]|uniref:alpha/beta fold hydrolase n=1 Tax=Roseateles sp. UC29_93 TaxID=3350177 RepID=UPI00366A862E
MNTTSQILRGFSIPALLVLGALAAMLALPLRAEAAATAKGARSEPSGKTAEPRPTIVLVHGAFADASSWNHVARRLRGQGYAVTAIANPLRGVASDARYTARVLDGISGPVVLVGHSYGGSVISAAAVGKPNVKALVFVAAFAPDAGESCASLSGKFPGSTLGGALAAAVPQDGGASDLYIRQDRFWQQFAADVPEGDALLMAVGQRPITDAALNEPTGEIGSAWKTLPSYFVFGTDDRNIPSAALAWMAERANSRGTVSIPSASHVPMISHPETVTKVIVQAARGG